MNTETSIVILNYLNYQDTIECVNSILENQYSINGVVIVDNGSDNESYDVLTDKYENEKNIYCLKSNKNLGFAKGNNLGIQFAREQLKSKFVLVVNNDTIFTDSEYVNKMVGAWKEDIGVVGSNVRLIDGTLARNFNVDLRFRGLMKSYCSWVMIRYDRKHLFKYLKWFGEPPKKIRLLNGCTLLFTPTFFERYDGFYPGTFLYNEERILYLMCERYNMKEMKVEDTEIFHKEDQSSLLSFNNNNKVKMKFLMQSFKHVLWNYFINKIMKVRRSRSE